MAGSLSEIGVTESGARSGAAARETELIARVARHDRRAFEELYNLYHRRLARFLTRLTRRYDLAEEIINDTFWVVWRSARNFRGDSQPSTWILGIAYRKARNAFRGAARARARQNLQPPSFPLTTEEPARAEELRDWLAAALSELPVEQRLAVELCYELGHSCEEIATIMGCPVNTVKTRLFHARAKLQKRLPELSGRPAAAPAGGARACRERRKEWPVMISGEATSREHEESWLLLPWLANGRLAGAERLRVEQHVRGCAECAREVELQRLWCATLTEPDRVTYAPGPSLRKLMERIDAAPAARPRTPGALAARAARAYAAWRPPGLAWAASFLLAVGVGTFATTAYRWSLPLYGVRTDMSAASPGVLHVAFDRSLTMGDAQQLLQSAGAHVVDGPDSTGVFGVAPNARATAGETPAQLRGLADRLRADARVRWVEPLPGAAGLQRAPGPPPREP